MIGLHNISFSTLDIISVFSIYLMISIYISALFFCKKVPYFIGYTYLFISISTLSINFIVAKGLYGDTDKFFHHWGVVGIIGTMMVLMFSFFRGLKEQSENINLYNYYNEQQNQCIYEKLLKKTQQEQYKKQIFDEQKYQQQKADKYLYEQLQENRDKQFSNDIQYKAESKGGVYHQPAKNKNTENITTDNENLNNDDILNEIYHNPSQKSFTNDISILSTNTEKEISIKEDLENNLLSKTQDMFYKLQIPVKQDLEQLKSEINTMHNDVQKIVDRIAHLFSLMSLVLKK